MEKMKAWVTTAKDVLELQERPVPELRENEALVKIKAMGICGSDQHYLHDWKIGDLALTGPLVLGHECSGEVVRVGKNVTRVNAGDRVVVEPGIACGKCVYCKSGKYNLCPDMQFMGQPPTDGCLQEYVAWPEDLLFKMPDSMTWQQGALIEPFTVALQALRLSRFSFASSAVVVGAGTIGLMTIQALKAAGAGTIIAADVNPFKLDMAKKLGATDTVNSAREDLPARVRELTDGLGAMYGYECCGLEATYYEMASLVRDGATVTLMGLLPEDGNKMPMTNSVLREIKYHTVIRYTNVFAEALTLLKYGRAEITPVLSHQFPFAEADKAFREAMTNKKDAIKVMINF